MYHHPGLGFTINSCGFFGGSMSRRRPPGMLRINSSEPNRITCLMETRSTILIRSACQLGTSFLLRSIGTAPAAPLEAVTYRDAGSTRRYQAQVVVIRAQGSFTGHLVVVQHILDKDLGGPAIVAYPSEQVQLPLLRAPPGEGLRTLP